LGPFQTSLHATAMSAFPPLATRQQTSPEVRFVGLDLRKPRPPPFAARGSRQTAPADPQSPLDMAATFFMLTRMERAWSPKSTGRHTSVSECAHVLDSENGPDTDVDLVEVRGGDEGFDGRRIHVPLFAEARSIASNSVSLKRQPSASRLVLA